MEHDRGIHRKTADLSARSLRAGAVNVSSTQPHGWGVQPKSLESTPATKAELWEKYQQAKQATQERANNRHLAPAQSTTLPIQAKLTIGEPGDKYEHEADQVASQVVEQIHAPAAAQSTQGESVQRQDELEEEIQAKPSISHLQRSPLSPAVQREAMPEEEDIQAKSILQREGIDEEEELQMKSLADSIQRVEIDDEGELQMKSLVQCREAIGGGEASTDLESSINSARGGGVAIENNIREPMEQAFGADFSGVKVHTDGQSDQLNRSIQARAFTTGQDVFFRQGEYNPGSRGGQELLAHELTHVVQQSGGAVQRSPSEEGKSTRPRRNAVVESMLTPEEIRYLQQFRDVANILKFNFAGSGEKAWKTHKENYAKPDKKQMETVEHQSKGIKYSKQKDTLDKKKTVFEYAGPLGGLFGSGAGIRDDGSNSTAENLEDAKAEFNKFMHQYIQNMHIYSQSRSNIQVKIKGFSRGAATASVFADWIKNSSFKTVVDVNLVLIDPVHGTGPLGQATLGAGLMPGKQDVSQVYDENAPDTSGTTYLLPIKSGHLFKSFTPQMISGYQRIIIGYGTGIKHSFGLGESEKSTLKYNGKPVKGMQLSTLPQGLFVVDAENMNIIKVPNIKIWTSHFQDEVLGKANKKEERNVAIEEALNKFFK